MNFLAARITGSRRSSYSCMINWASFAFDFLATFASLDYPASRCVAPDCACVTHSGVGIDLE
jgi:hypothetical protein